MADPLPLIGRDYVLVRDLARALHNEARRHGDYTPLCDVPRGQTFQVRLVDGRIVKVTVALDRVETKGEGSWQT